MSTTPAPAMPLTNPGKPLSLTLIVATTPSLGIGLKGTLPWPSHKADMAYFARVTKRPPTSSPQAKNVVIMGRKTWESIPTKFRPLRDRINIVVTRNKDFDAGIPKDHVSLKRGDDVLIAGSLRGAVEMLEKKAEEKEATWELGKAFVIGGGSIYKEALEMKETDRVLLTKIQHEYECDTRFPVDLEGQEGREKGWAKKSREELSGFVGEEIEEGQKEENGIPYEFCMFER